MGLPCILQSLSGREPARFLIVFFLGLMMPKHKPTVDKKQSSIGPLTVCPIANAWDSACSSTMKNRGAGFRQQGGENVAWPRRRRIALLASPRPAAYTAVLLPIQASSARTGHSKLLIALIGGPP
jgi:hypothetical protein